METDAKVQGLWVRADGQDAKIEKLEDLVEKVRDRVPPWIVWTMTMGGGVIGSLITLLAMCAGK